MTLTGSGIETLQENQYLRDRIVQRVYERGYVAVEEPKSLTTSMNGDTLLVEYEVPGMAHESAGGVYVVDFLYWHGGEARWFLYLSILLIVAGIEYGLRRLDVYQRFASDA